MTGLHTMSPRERYRLLDGVRRYGELYERADPYATTVEEAAHARRLALDPHSDPTFRGFLRWSWRRNIKAARDIRLAGKLRELP